MHHAFGFDTLFLSGNTFAELAVSGWFEHQLSYHANAQKFITQIIKFIDRHKSRKTFIYCHLNDLHEPIVLPESYNRVFGDLPNLKNLARWDFINGESIYGTEFEKYKETRIRLYDSAIYFVDQQVRTLAEYLRQESLWDKTILIVTADHGEEFWDHAETEKRIFFDPRDSFGIGHGHAPFQELIKVPLLIKAHGTKPNRIKTNCSLVDLAPTSLSMCGLKSEYQFNGSNIFETSEDRAILCEESCYGYKKESILYKQWKLIFSKCDGVELLYDLSSDPKEQKNLSSQKVKKLEYLKSLLELHFSESNKKYSTEILDVDKRIAEHLKNMGYLD